MQLPTNEEECKQLDPHLAYFVDQWHQEDNLRTLSAYFKLVQHRNSLDIQLTRVELADQVIAGEDAEINTIHVLGFPFHLQLATKGEVPGLGEDSYSNRTKRNYKPFRDADLSNWASHKIFQQKVQADDTFMYPLVYTYARITNETSRGAIPTPEMEKDTKDLINLQNKRERDQSYYELRQTEIDQLRSGQVTTLNKAMQNKDWGVLYRMRRYALCHALFGEATYGQAIQQQQLHFLKPRMTKINRYLQYKIRSDETVSTLARQLFEKVSEDDKLPNKQLRAIQSMTYQQQDKQVEAFKPTALNLFL